LSRCRPLTLLHSRRINHLHIRRPRNTHVRPASKLPQPDHQPTDLRGLVRAVLQADSCFGVECLQFQSCYRRGWCGVCFGGGFGSVGF
jgi:hypothetical protein